MDTLKAIRHKYINITTYGCVCKNVMQIGLCINFSNAQVLHIITFFVVCILVVTFIASNCSLCQIDTIGISIFT